MKLLLLSGSLIATTAALAEPALTIYNGNFAVVRDSVHLDLTQGINTVNYTGATMHLEPDSVVLRDPSGQRALQILEQNYRADPVSEGLLLNYFEGKTIQFETERQANGTTTRVIIPGKIIRSGYVPHTGTYNLYGQDYAAQQSLIASASQPIIEINGQLMFRLPGQPLFPSLPDDSILKPTLTWQINSADAGALDAELGYITTGMSWHADYNLVAPENAESLDLVGWITMDNQTGKSFENAKIKLMAGDVNRVQRPMAFARSKGSWATADASAPPVSEKAFDEYHLYTLQRLATLLDREAKQVEFVRASGIPSQTIYIYDGADLARYGGYETESVRSQPEMGVESNTKISVMREFYNSASNHLGMPLPMGRLRFYRRDADGQLEFTGESSIDHTPRDERIRVATGNAFDIVGERTRTDFRQSAREHWIDESYSIKLRNHKKQPVEIRVVEHLFRWNTWTIPAKSDDFTKTDAQTIEFRVDVKPDVERTVTYSVHYSW